MYTNLRLLIWKPRSNLLLHQTKHIHQQLR